MMPDDGESGCTGRRYGDGRVDSLDESVCIDGERCVFVTDCVNDVRVDVGEDSICLGRLGEGAAESVEDICDDEEQVIVDGETGYVGGT